jgi:hypothetical protein
MTRPASHNTEHVLKRCESAVTEVETYPNLDSRRKAVTVADGMSNGRTRVVANACPRICNMGRNLIADGNRRTRHLFPVGEIRLQSTYGKHDAHEKD